MRKIFVILGMAFASAAAFFVFVFPNPYALLVTRALGGVAASAWVTFTILGAAYYSPENTGKCMGHLSACNAFGRMAALLAGGLIAQQLGLEYAFLLGGIFGLIGMAASFLITEKKPSPEIKPPTLADLLLVAKNKQLVWCSILGILFNFIVFATTFGFIPLAASQLNATQFHLGLLGVVSTLPTILFAPLAGTIMPRKLGVKATLTIGFMLAAAGSAAVVFSSTLTILFIVQIIGSIGAAILGTLLLALCISDIPPLSRAAAMGFYQAVYGIGMFLGPVITGQISYAFGLNAAFIFTAFIGIIGAVLINVLKISSRAKI
jgi:MFS family permease